MTQDTNLPLLKGGITPLCKRGARGDLIGDVNSILSLLIYETNLKGKRLFIK
jgi:hypothetical protein